MRLKLVLEHMRFVRLLGFDGPQFRFQVKFSIQCQVNCMVKVMPPRGVPPGVGAGVWTQACLARTVPERNEDSPSTRSPPEHDS